LLGILPNPEGKVAMRWIIIKKAARYFEKDEQKLLTIFL